MDPGRPGTLETRTPLMRSPDHPPKLVRRHPGPGQPFPPLLAHVCAEGEGARKVGGASSGGRGAPTSRLGLPLPPPPPRPSTPSPYFRRIDCELLSRRRREEPGGLAFWGLAWALRRCGRPRQPGTCPCPRPLPLTPGRAPRLPGARPLCNDPGDVWEGGGCPCPGSPLGDPFPPPAPWQGGGAPSQVYWFHPPALPPPRVLVCT